MYSFLLLGTVLHYIKWNGPFAKKLPHNFLESSPVIEMSTRPFRPYASVGVKVWQIASAMGLKMKKRLTNSIPGLNYEKNIKTVKGLNPGVISKG